MLLRVEQGLGARQACRRSAELRGESIPAGFTDTHDGHAHLHAPESNRA